MIDYDSRLAERRRVSPAVWKGLVPAQLLDRLAPEPRIGGALCALGDALLGAMDGRTLELVALRVSAVRDCHYVWGAHCTIATTRDEGALTEGEVARVAAGSPALHGRDALIVAAVDEILVGGRFGAWTEDALGGEALSVLVAAHFYDTMASVMAGAPPETPPIDGLESPERAAQGVPR